MGYERCFTKVQKILIILVNFKLLKRHSEFVHLGRLLTWNNDFTKDKKGKNNKAKGVMAGLYPYGIPGIIEKVMTPALGTYGPSAHGS